VTGPTGSGKSTTLAASLEWVNERMARHVVTIEDPMEFEFRAKQCFFTQREVGLDTDSFSSGLRSALRQAPDIIFVGEIRDAETALTALQAAETGHLVLGNLHSSSVTDALERFLHLMDSTQREGVQSLLSFQLLGVLSQQLLPNATDDGSVLVYEHLDVEAAVRDWIREMRLPEIREFMQRGDSEWNGTFQKNIFNAYANGRISYEMALAHCSNHNEFNRLLRGIS
jgi:pilus retraction protein PilT